MSKTNDLLKNIIAKRYSEVKKEEQSDLKPIEKTEREIKKETCYIPHRIVNKYFLLKVEFFLDMEDSFVADSGIEIVGIVPLSQKIIALQYENTQTKSLKYYYDSQKNKEFK